MSDKQTPISSASGARRHLYTGDPRPFEEFGIAFSPDFGSVL